MWMLICIHFSIKNPSKIHQKSINKTTSTTQAAQDAPRRSQDAPKTRQDAPKTPQDGPRRPQDAPRCPQEAPKTPPRRPQDRLKTLLRRPKAARRPQDAPETPQDAPKTPQEVPRSSPRRTKTHPKLLGDFLKLFRNKTIVVAIQPRTSSNTQERFWTDLKKILGRCWVTF